MLSKLDSKLGKLIKTACSDLKTMIVIVYVKNMEMAINFFQEKRIIIRAKYPFLNALCVEITLDNLHLLAKQSCISYISSQSNINTLSYVAKKIINVEKFYSENIFGKGINVAIIDTGISPHIDFLLPNNRIMHFVDFVNKESHFYDDNGHGTFITGLVASNGLASGKKYSGIAPLCNIFSLKALDKDGQSTSVEMLEAMQWIFDNKEKFNIDVVCMSFGAIPTSKYDPLMKGAEKLWDYGLTVVAAAGNSGPDKNTIKSPGISRKIITVGSFDDHRNEEEEFENANFSIADFSSRGPAFEFFKPDLVVSGVNLVSCGNKETYTKMSGTSVSAPLVAGICALLIEKYKRKINPNQIKTLLQKCCTPIVRDRNTEGYGYLSF